MTLSIDDRRIDTVGLWAQAYRLHRFNLDQKPGAIFFKLLRARISSLVCEDNFTTVVA